MSTSSLSHSLTVRISDGRIIAYAALSVGTELRLDADVVIHSSANTLLASEVSFRRLDRNVSEQELDLFQLSAKGRSFVRNAGV